jgi:hypothetical protein
MTRSGDAPGPDLIRRMSSIAVLAIGSGAPAKGGEAERPATEPPCVGVQGGDALGLPRDEQLRRGFILKFVHPLSWVPSIEGLTIED